MAHCTQVVDFVRLGFLDDTNQVACIAQVTVVQLKVGVVDVWVLVDMVYALGVEAAGPALDAVNDIAFFQQEFGKIRAVLASNTSDKCDFRLGHDAFLKNSDRPLQGLAVNQPWPASLRH